MGLLPCKYLHLTSGVDLRHVGLNPEVLALRRP